MKIEKIDNINNLLENKDNRILKSFISCFIEFSKIRIKEENVPDITEKQLEIYVLEFLEKRKDRLTIFALMNDTFEIVGFLVSEKMKSDIIYFKKKEYLYINYLYISEKYQGKGYSTKLKNELLKEAKEIGIDEIKLHVSNMNKKAKFIYEEKWGFDNNYSLLSLNNF